MQHIPRRLAQAVTIGQQFGALAFIGERLRQGCAAQELIIIRQTQPVFTFQIRRVVIDTALQITLCAVTLAVAIQQQAVAILRELHALTGRGQYVFPGGRSPRRPMSNNAINAALRRMGYAKEAMTAHGFRASARTLLDEVLGFRPDYIEHQLAHAVRDPNGRAYNRTSHLPERRKMMQAWADYLDTLRTGGNVVPLRKASGASR